METLEKDVSDNRPETDVLVVPGTRSFHQVKKKGPYKVLTRSLSCFCPGCEINKTELVVNQKIVEPFVV